MDQRALKVKRMPALLALLLAALALLPTAAGAEHRAGSPVAASAIETPAAILDHQSDAGFAEPGESDPWDGGDAGVLIASAQPTASLAGGMEQSSPFECPARPSATNRARAPPSL